MLFRKLFQSSAPVAPVPASAIPEPVPATAPAAPVPATDYAAELKVAQEAYHAAQNAFSTLQSENAILSAEVTSLKGQIAEITAARDAAQALANKTREDLTQEIKQKEMALLAASQGVPITEVPPETQTDPQNQADTREALMEKYKASRDNRERGEIIAKLKSLK